MTGTPIVDQPDEIVPLLNLVLPDDKHFTKNTFIEEFFDIDQNIQSLAATIPLYKWKDGAKEVFKNRIRGRISYVKRDIDVKLEYQGEVLGNMKSIKLVSNRMIENGSQDLLYKKFATARGFDFDENILNNEDEELVVDKKKNAFYDELLQSTLFVFPPTSSDEVGSIGKKGMNEYITKKYECNEKLKQVLSGLSRTSKLEQLAKYSVMYSNIIREITAKENKNELVYVYSNSVDGSGILTFMALLKLFGFKLIRNKSDMATSKTVNDEYKKRRMILLNDKVCNQKDFQILIEEFNKPENKHGDYCKVILCTPIAKEGISLKNVQQIHIITPPWNMGEVLQAMSRGIRTRSHEQLENPIVRIFFHASFPYHTEGSEHTNELMKSVSYQLYYRSEIKERNSKLIERIFLESSWDCLMNVPINSKGRYDDYSRDCEYMECEYRCDGITTTTPGTDVSNYNLYYSDVERYQIITKIINLFENQSICAEEDIFEYINFKDLKIVEDCLLEILYSPIIINYKKGFPSFLSYSQGVYFLTDNPYLPYSNKPYSYYYWKHPSTSIMYSFSDNLDSHYLKNQNNLTKTLITLISNNHSNASTFFSSFPPNFQQIFCEETILAELKKKTRIGFKKWFTTNEDFKKVGKFLETNTKLQHNFGDKTRQLNVNNLQRKWYTQD
jgi:hypothetical protein